MSDPWQSTAKAQTSQLFAEHPLFRELAAEVRQRLLESARTLFLDPGELLYRTDEPARGVFVLLRGVLQIELPQRPASRGFVAAMLPAPAFLGESQALHGLLWSGTGVAVTPLLALELPAATFDALLGSEPGFARRAYHELSRRFVAAIDTEKIQQAAAPAESLARYLLTFRTAVELSEPGLSTRLSLPQSALALATGLRRETVNRLLGVWGQNGWVVWRQSHLEGLDEEALTRLLAEGSRRLLLRTLEVATPVPAVAKPLKQGA
jgi:CRP/FNR family transcriptional regulator, anaerobic regulatory protein